ncbi:hypothetical protein CA267_018675 [Alteromonas pelagimontana]|uniref:DUF2569 domain-containing protein n=1 Tax=Alteromonas pelagimontana TaxID=1858656 RepID=A0A6M4MHY9_9ALTE|nr:hypothetical protein [Alteromonas pelagimontana]QJR82632.1 hypothetical protein CA267_018675 [Alteromonas pelagimontana]
MKIVSTHPWHITAGLVIWAVWFVAIYGGLSVACVVSPPPPDSGVFNWINAALMISTLVTSAYLAWCALLCWRRMQDSVKQARFTLRLAAAVYLVGCLATLAVGVPTMVIVPCL